MELFDSHAHYDDGAFDPDRTELLMNLPSSGITGVINAGTTVRSSQKALELAHQYDYIFAAVGIHPEEIDTLPPDDLDKISHMLLTEKKAVALGEIGLDYHYEGTNKESQLRLFEKQLAMACGVNKPVIIHDRDAHSDTLRLIKKYRPKGVVHCFSGSAEMAQEILTIGLYIGFTGVVTFKNNRKAEKALAVIPLDRILIETDCPYMAPEPMRGRRCDSSMLSFTLRRIAEIKGLDPNVAAAQTAQNARELFSLTCLT